MIARELARPVLLDWLENWARWLHGGNRSYLGMSDVGNGYESPERNHHEPPRARIAPIPVYVSQAQLVESLVHAPTFAPAWFAAVRVTHYLLSDDYLRRDHKARERWAGIRARAARQLRHEYLDNLEAAYTRLGRDLAPWAHALPKAA